jgi:hypothetical protein
VASGLIVRSQAPISFWGGVDPDTGVIVDHHHDRRGVRIAGCVFVFPEEKGSSTASAVLVELIRNGHAPAALITERTSPILALGAIVASEMYGRTLPVLVVEAGNVTVLENGAYARIALDGTIHITQPGASDCLPCD